VVAPSELRLMLSHPEPEMLQFTVGGTVFEMSGSVDDGGSSPTRGFGFGSGRFRREADGNVGVVPPVVEPKEDGTCNGPEATSMPVAGPTYVGVPALKVEFELPLDDTAGNAMPLSESIAIRVIVAKEVLENFIFSFAD
jgi:hypothetical protein